MTDDTIKAGLAAIMHHKMFYSMDDETKYEELVKQIYNGMRFHDTKPLVKAFNEWSQSGGDKALADAVTEFMGS